MKRLLNWLCARPTVNLGHSEPVQAPALPTTLELLIAEWTRDAKRGGSGSDIAAAKAHGAMTAVLCLGAKR